jgi:hypothetical protein
VQFPDSFPVATYTASIGLALKRTPLKILPGDEQSRFLDIDVNILAGKYRKPKAKPVSAGKIWLGVLLAICITLLYPLYQARQHVKINNLNLETDLSNIQRELNLATLVNEEIIKTEDTIKAIDSAADAIKSSIVTVLGTRGDFGDGLRLVTGVMPSQIIFTSIEVRPGDITVRGETDSVFSVVEYATALETENKFFEVRITALDEDVSSLSSARQPVEPSEVKVITFEILIQKQPPAASTK